MSDPTGLDAARLHGLLARREIGCRDLLSAFLERIGRVDRKLNACLRINPDAERQADEADGEYAAGRGGPLTGIPIAVKDNICTAGIETSCGSKSLAGYLPPRDATAVARLRAAGAIILCKTNMDEFGMGSSTENSAFGPTRNPWDTERVAGGSSGGSAAAVAARMAPLALGSDTGGSIRQPAAFCGVYGLKPTYGRVSRFGLVAYGSSLDQIGPMAGTATDAAALLQCISGADPNDMTAAAEAAEEIEDYPAACSKGVRGMTIGIPMEFFEEPLDPEIASAVHSAAARLRELGGSTREVSIPHARYALPAYYLAATSEASSNLARYDGVRYGLRAAGVRDLLDMYRRSRSAGFGEEVKRRIMLGTYALSAGYREAFYEKAQRLRAMLRESFAGLFAEGVDLLLTPTTPTTAFKLGEKTADPLAMYLSDIYTVTANLTGLPALSFPLDLSGSGLPIGGQLIAPPFKEALLLRAAASLEGSR
jgi:aspartyl-tRNA(Asn)/glutamyl-tRNA(Gln) amidotransferase subunit A